MSSYLSNLLTQTTSRYQTIRRTLLANEEDGDTEDDSHITRVLRAYYTEKGRPFPGWLPPDPNEKTPLTQHPAVQAASGYFNSSLGRNQPPNPQAQYTSAGRSSLSDLWDAPNAAPAQPQSLRPGRNPAPTPSYMSNASNNNLAPPPQALPLPSQRAGSYQSMQSQSPSRPSFEPRPTSGSVGGTAQDRLKARLWGGSGSRPGSSTNGSYQAPPSSSGNQYASGGSYGR